MGWHMIREPKVVSRQKTTSYMHALARMIATFSEQSQDQSPEYTSARGSLFPPSTSVLFADQDNTSENLKSVIGT